jgi:hypothetical protein
MNRAQRRAAKSKKKDTLRIVNGVLVNNQNNHGLISKSVRRK